MFAWSYWKIIFTEVKDVPREVGDEISLFTTMMFRLADNTSFVMYTMCVAVFLILHSAGTV